MQRKEQPGQRKFQPRHQLSAILRLNPDQPRFTPTSEIRTRMAAPHRKESLSNGSKYCAHLAL